MRSYGNYLRNPPIHRAARRGDLAALQRLLDAGGRVDARADLSHDSNLHGMTPLMTAARSVRGADVTTLAFLLERGADLHAVSARGMTAAWYAAGDGGREPQEKAGKAADFLDRLRFLLDAGLDAREGESDGKSLLAQAADAGDPARVRLLLERGASPLPSTQAGACRSSSFPLFCAALSGSAACILLLLDAGAGVNRVDDSGFPALAYAWSAEAARALLDAGSRFDQQDKWGDDVLNEILERAEREAEWNEMPDPFGVARVVLEAGASLAQPDESGNTRLHDAAFRKQAHVVAFLLDQGAPIRGNKWSATPLHKICWQGEMHGAAAEENAAIEPIIRRLVAAGNSVDARDADGQTPLHEAVEGDWENPFAVRILLALGTEVDPIDAKGQTPLHVAARRGSLESVRLLLAAGADANRPDADGWTPISMAFYHEEIWQNIVCEDKPSPGGTAAETEDTAALRRLRHEEVLRTAAESVGVLVREFAEEAE